MPIIFIHGVAVRDQAAWAIIEPFLRRYIAPDLSDDPDNVKMIPVYWYPFAARFAWDGKSRPLSPLLGMGAALPPDAPEKAIMMASVAEALRRMPATAVPSSIPTGLIAAGPSATPSHRPFPFRLRDLTPGRLSDLISSVAQSKAKDERQFRLGSLATDMVAHDPATFPSLAALGTTEEELAWIEGQVQTRYDQLEKLETGLTGQGPSWLQGFQDRIGEAMGRSEDAPGFALTQVFAEFRRPLNDLASRFLGDVFVYLRERGTPQAPGPIPSEVLKSLKEAHDDQQKRGGEPVVIITHSMGGQLLYDAVTAYLPLTPGYDMIRVDFWAAIASQVPFFEELKLFLASDNMYSLKNNNKTPFPDLRYLGEWWNVWDSNDFLSFTAREVFESVKPGAVDSPPGVMDEEYSTGMFASDAHSGYFLRPSFYRRLAEKLREAKKRNWRRT